MTLFFTGQIMGGKNNIIITRSGLRFPKKSWATWRDGQVASIRAQLPLGFKMITEPINISLQYTAGDRRRRDMPAIIDSIFHVLEKAGVVEDDTLLWVGNSARYYDKSNPEAVVDIPYENEN